MSVKTNVRKLPTLSLHIPLSHRRFQNRAAAVYDMSIDCHDIETICHIHRLPESIILQDWKGNQEYLQTKLNFSNRKDIRKRFLTIMKEIENDNIQPTLAAIAHHIPFVYIEQAIAERDIINACNRFLDDFNPKTTNKEIELKEENVIQKQFDDGHPVLTPFEQHLLVEHLTQYISTSKLRRLILIEKCLLQYIQLIHKTNYPSLTPVAHLDQGWLKSFLLQARPQLHSVNISWLNLD